MLYEDTIAQIMDGVGLLEVWSPAVAPQGRMAGAMARRIAKRVRTRDRRAGAFRPSFRESSLSVR
jgi:hypothetical protein